MRNRDWIYIGTQPVGGLREIGFIGESDFLMVLGGAGRTVYDCQTSIKYARDKNDYYSEKWNPNTGIIEGFGEFKDQDVLCGGFEFKDVLAKRTEDYWQTEIRKEKRYDYKNELKDAEVLYLKNLDNGGELMIRDYLYGITRSYGFSPTNNCFIAAESHGVYFWKRINSNLSEQISTTIERLNSASGTKVNITDEVATIGLSLEPYQTSKTNLVLTNFGIEHKSEGSMIRLLGDNQQIEIRKNMIKQVNILKNEVQFFTLLRDVVWRRITIKF
jgi:hypothetical protein